MRFLFGINLVELPDNVEHMPALPQLRVRPQPTELPLPTYALVDVVYIRRADPFLDGSVGQSPVMCGLDLPMTHGLVRASLLEMNCTEQMLGPHCTISMHSSVDGQEGTYRVCRRETHRS